MPSHILSSTPSSQEYNRKHRAVGRVAGLLSLVSGAAAFIVGIVMSGFTSFALTAPVLQNLNNASNLAWGPNAPRSIGGIVGNIILVVLGLLGVIFVVLLTYGGFLWLSSAGEEDKVKKAQGLIFNSIIGALIVIAAYVITYYVLRKLAGAIG